MAKRIMSEAEQRRRQKLQSQIGRTTSTMGLSALGVTGAAALAGSKGAAGERALGTIRKIPGLKNATPHGMERAAIKSGIVSGGIGGVGGFNQASIYSAESRRRKQAVPVKKDYGMEMGYYGEEGTPLTHEQIEAEIEKAWTPSASNFDSEKSRKKRPMPTAVQLGDCWRRRCDGAHHGMEAVHQAKKLKPISQLKALTKEGGALRHGGKAAAGLAAVAGAAATHSAIKRKKSDSWQPYAKRDTTSAFGVDHSDNPNGQHRETEN